MALKFQFKPACNVQTALNMSVCVQAKCFIQKLAWKETAAGYYKPLVLLCHSKQNVMGQRRNVHFERFTFFIPDSKKHT